jgi:hypothetical protein
LEKDNNVKAGGFSHKALGAPKSPPTPPVLKAELGRVVFIATILF